jgi:S1-C subfamily serine protease
MRLIFSLVALLVVFGVMAWIFRAVEFPADTAAIHALDQERGQAQRISGVDASGIRVRDSITLEAETFGQPARGLIVKSIIAGGPMDSSYGLQPGDKIVRVPDADDSELSDEQVFTAWQRRQAIVVLRDGKEMTLKAPKN